MPNTQNPTASPALDGEIITPAEGLAADRADLAQLRLTVSDASLGLCSLPRLPGEEPIPLGFAIMFAFAPRDCEAEEPRPAIPAKPLIDGEITDKS